jgi:3-keto-5-aminohexanoate cleavage enzyme
VQCLTETGKKLNVASRGRRGEGEKKVERQSEQKILISVAPVGKAITDGDVANPLHPEEVARQVVACAEAGAAMVHLHVRDAHGNPTAKLDEFRSTLDMIRRDSDIIIQGSTGGAPNLSLEERCVSLREPRVEVASLNMGTVNFGDETYINTLPDIRYWAGQMREHKVRPELEVFDLSMMGTSAALLGDGTLEAPLHFNFCLGFPGALAAEADMLLFLKSQLPVESTWGLIHDGMRDFSLLAAAVGMGASGIRVGFEDSVSYARGQKARGNLELVERIVGLVRQMGREVASPTEARKMLGLQIPPKE